MKLLLTNQETSDYRYLCVNVCVWFSRSARHIRETCMFPSQPVSPLLWGAPSSEAKDAFLYSHTSTKKRRYRYKLQSLAHNAIWVPTILPCCAKYFPQVSFYTFVVWKLFEIMKWEHKCYGIPFSFVKLNNAKFPSVKMHDIVSFFVQKTRSMQLR